MRVKLLFLFLFLTINTIKGQTLKEAQYFLDRSDYKKAIELFDKINNRAVKQENAFEVVKAQNGIADCYSDLGAYQKSISILKSNIKLLKKSKSKNYLLFAETHMLLANNYDFLHLWEDYKQETNNFYYYYKKGYPNKEIYKALYYAYLGRYYNVKYQLPKSKYYTGNALKIYHRNINDAHLIDIYKLYIAHAFTIRNAPVSYADRFKYADSISRFANKKYPYNNIKKSRVLISISAFNLDKASGLQFLKTGPIKGINENEAKLNAIKAISNYDKAIIINDRFSSFHNPSTAYLNSLKGLMCFYLKDYDKAIKSYNEGISRLSNLGKNSQAFTLNNYQMLVLLRWKSWCLDEMYSANKNTKLLYEINTTLSLMEKVWIRYSNELIDSKEQYYTDTYNMIPYPFLMKNNFELYQLTNQQQYLEKAAEYDEKLRYSSLLNDIYLNQTQKNKNNLLNKKREKTYISLCDLLLSKSSILNSKENQFQEDLVNFLDEEKKTNLIKKGDIVSLKEIQDDLKPNEAIISYNFLHYQNVFIPYIKLIEKNKIKIVRVREIENDDYLAETFLSKSLNKALKDNNVKLFKQEAYNLYKNYFEPIEKQLSKNITHLEIIPDAEFSNLPFEVLLFKDSRTNDFRKLPYLALKYNFSYSLSSSITKLNNNRKRKLFDKTAVFSPTFDGKKLSQLDISKKRAKAIAEHYKATFFDGKNADIKSFKLGLVNNKIISVFSHGQSFNDFEDNKKGIFLSDGFLSLNEIYNLKSNCDFLILGACETGYGGKEKGEGNINLARAFSSIGVKSMMLASWKIDEETTMEITELFFKYLDEGYSKSEALQKAKLDFLKTADPRTANPYYWSGLNIVGNNDPIKLSGTNYLWYLIFIFPVAVGLWYFRKRRRKVKSLL